MKLRYLSGGILIGIIISITAFFPSLRVAVDQLSLRFWNVREQISFSRSGDRDDKIGYIYQLLDIGYYDHEKVDQERMEENALKGYVEALGDPHTEYLTKKENEVFSEGMEGTQHFEGIGAVVTKKKDGVMITEVLKWSPAFKAGLQPLDMILKIDDESTQSLELSDAVEKIRGPKGSEVTLGVLRMDAKEEPQFLEVAVTRDTIDVPSVTATILTGSEDTILYVTVAIFGEDTIVRLRKDLLQLSGSYDGVILDLRGDGGGYLPTAIELASFFLPKNEVITTAKYAIFPEEVFRSEGYGEFEGKPLVVLVDGLSASASEIVAGALAQRGDALLVGTQTFGKGSIQTIQPLSDGSLLKYTIGKRYLPNGTTIDHSGLTPNITVEFDPDVYSASGVDNQFQRAVEEMGKIIWG